MKRLATGLTIGVAMAFCAPAWAQAPMTPSSPPAPAAPSQAHHRVVHHGTHHHVVHHYGGGGGGSMADQLNAQELARITGGAPPEMAPAGAARPGKTPR
jgi:hypothetical protein